MNDFFYLNLEDCFERLFDVALEFDESESTPHYADNHYGLESLNGVLERVQEYWYEGIYGKATYLFLAINKGHFFINGNKRLALILTLEFLKENGYTPKRIRLRKYLSWFENNFPNYKVSDKNFDRNYGWAFFNLNKAVADSQVDHDDLKEKVNKFLKDFIS